MMFALLLIAADPTGLRAALESSDSAKVTYVASNQTVLLRPSDLKELINFVEIEGDVRESRGIPATANSLAMEFRKGDSVAQYTLIECKGLWFGKNRDKYARLTDRRLGEALLRKFGEEPESRSPMARQESPSPTTAFHVEEIDKLGVDVAVIGNYVLVAEETIALYERQGNALVHTQWIPFPIGGDNSFYKPRLTVHDEWAYVSSGSMLFAYRLAAGKLQLFQTTVGSRLGLRAIHGMVAVGEYFYTIDSGKRLDVFGIATDGKLTHLETVTHERLKSGLGITATDRAVYVACYDLTLLTFLRDTNGKLSYGHAEVDKEGGFVYELGTRRAPGRGLLFASDIVIEGDSLYVLGRKGTVSLWRIDDVKPVFVKSWSGAEHSGDAVFTDILVAKGKLWLATDAASLICFEVGHDRLLSNPQCVLGLEEGVRSLAFSGDALYAVGERLWIVRMNVPEK